MFGRSGGGSQNRKAQGQGHRQPQPPQSRVGGQPVENVSSYKPWAGTQIGNWLSQEVGSSLEENLRMMRQLSPTGDTRITEFTVLGGQGPRAALVFIDGLSDKTALEDRVIRPLQETPAGRERLLHGPRQGWLVQLAERSLPIAGHTKLHRFEELMSGLTAGQSLLLLDGAPGALLLNTQGWPERSIEAAPTETTIHGPKVGFSENIAVNLALIRRQIQDPTLRLEPFEIGIRSKTKVVVAYIEALARPALVEEVKRRLSRIDTDYINSTHQVSELMNVGYYGPFTLQQITERPDRVAYTLHLGKVAVFVDGTPDVAVMPSVMAETMITMDDFYIQPAMATFQRLLRAFAWLIVVFTPAAYVAVMAYNPDILRVDLVIVLAGARVGVPINVVMEVLLLELMMELLQEATIRLPTKIGSAATVVGGLIIGQAAAQARLVSNIMVVVVAMTAIASFAFPVYEQGVAWRIVKWVNVAAAALFGLFGLYVSMTFVMFYLNSLESFGTPYLIPLSPLSPGDLLRNIITRQPFWSRKKRPPLLQPREEESALTGEAVKP